MKITLDTITELRKIAALPKFAADTKAGWLAHLHWPLFLAIVPDAPGGGDVLNISIVPIDEMEPLSCHVTDGLFKLVAANCEFENYSVAIHKGPPPPEHLALSYGAWQGCLRTVAPRFLIEADSGMPVPLDPCEDLTPFVEKAAAWYCEQTR